MNQVKVDDKEALRLIQEFRDSLIGIRHKVLDELVFELENFVDCLKTDVYNVSSEHNT